MSNLKDLEKTLGNKKTKEALSESLGLNLSDGLKGLGDSIKKIFGADAKRSGTAYSKNQITKNLERYEKKLIESRSQK